MKRKKDTLYTVNRFNRPLFMKPADVDRTHQNIFDGYESSLIRTDAATTNLPGFTSPKFESNGISLDLNDLYGNTAAKVSAPVQQASTPIQQIAQAKSTPGRTVTADTSGLNYNVSVKPIIEENNGITDTNSFSHITGKDTEKPQKVQVSQSTGQVLGGAAAQAGAIPFTVDGRHYKRGMFDATDPFYHAGDVTFSDGNKGHIESDAGNMFSDLGVGVFQGGASSGNGYVMLAGAALKSIGDIINNGWGIAVNDEKLGSIKDSMRGLRNYQSANSLDDISDVGAQINTNDVYRGGVFSGDDARRKNEDLATDYANVYSFAKRARRNNAKNILQDQAGWFLKNYSAYGGPIEKVNSNANMKNNVFDFGGPLKYYEMSQTNDLPALSLDLAYRDLARKEQNAQNKNQITNMFMGTPSTMFAIGGDLQTNSSDFSTGLTHINAGKSHEENPYDGVQMGVDNNNVPNLVEEGEAVWNDYVFSNRINLDNHTKALLHFPKKKDITYADAAKKLEKEIAERPNDPISEAGFKAQMEKLEENQERQKQEMEAERAKAAFEALSPEEQAVIMQRAAQEEAAAQQAAMQQQAMAQQGMTSEEAAMAQQQMLQADGSQAMIGQEPQMACGGKINKYAEGGYKKNAGSWKKGNSSENWLAYTKNGLRDYLLKVNDDIAAAETEEEKKKIREEAIKTVNGIQKAYSEAYQSNLSPSEKSEKVEALQKAFEKAGGNAYFGGIANNINLPKGHNTEDTEEKGWVDGYWGPRTSIRNWGSTEYGDADYYNDIAELAQEAGLTYAPGEYNYGDHKLYQLGMAPEEPIAVVENDPELVVDYGDANGNSPEVMAPATPQAPPVEDQRDVVPDKRPGWLRYAGLFGPAVGLGMQALGIGRPDKTGIDAAIRAGNGPVALANYKPIGDYMTYRPLDIWYAQNALNAKSRATDRAILNNAAPVGTRMAGLLASGYNDQLASGNLFRQSQEYNDALQKQVKEFNRGTNQFNAEAYNRNSQFNAEARNRARQTGAQLALQGEMQKADMDAGWYNGIYGNVAGLFKGIGDLGKENEQHNMISRMAANGLFGTATPNTPVFQDFIKWQKEQNKEQAKKSKGGKNHKKHDIIL